MPNITIAQHVSSCFRLPGYVDVALLFVALSAAAFFALKKRSRAWIIALSAVSLAYFGFIRRGCVCPVGAFQNMVQVLVDKSVFLPVEVWLFFVLPLLSAFIFGRVFCGAVCPLGAFQDICVVKPVHIPSPVSRSLHFLAYVVLWLAFIFVVNNAGYLICRYDPYVAFFRMSGSWLMLGAGLGILGLGMFVARPFCRFLCPYGVFLSWISAISLRHVKIAPDECVQCKLCEQSCPFSAIEKPDAENVNRKQGVRILGWVMAGTPVWMAGFAFAGVRLARAISDTPRISVSMVSGLVLGLCFSAKLVSLSVRRLRTGYNVDKAHCLSCGRCFIHCPKERERLGMIGGGREEHDLPTVI